MFFLTPAHRAWGYSHTLCRQGGFSGLKLVGVPQPKHMHGFSQNFQDMFNPRGSRADYVLGVTWQLLLLPWQKVLDFSVLNFVGVPQPKPMHGFSSEF